MKYAAWSVIFINTQMLVQSSFLNISCNINSSYQIDITVNYLTNSIAIVCNNNTLHTSSVENCVQRRKFSTVYINNCFVPNDIINSTILYYADAVSLWDVQTDERFVFANLVTNSFILKMHNVKEIIFDNMPFLRSVVVRNSEWQISSSSFLNVPQLTLLSSFDSQKISINESIFNFLPNLEILIFENSSLSANWLEIFSGSNKLKLLSLFRSGLTSLPTDVFANMYSLKSLFIDRNALSDLPPVLLSNNRLLEVLDISRNPLQHLPEELLQNCWRLLGFSASGCRLASIPEKLFSNCPLLMNVSLDDNLITTIHPETFAKTTLLQLQLSGNILSSLPSGLFFPNNLLIHLNLSRNSFTQIPSSSYEKIFSLKQLDLSSNSIETVEVKDFIYLAKLEILDLSRNKIHKFDEFDNTKNLRYLNLAFNDIEEFPRLPWSSYKASVIDLSYNNITRLSSSDLPYSGFINLQHNQINMVSVKESTFPNASLQLNFNPFSCQCTLRDFVKSIQNHKLNVTDAEHLTCHDRLKHSKLMSVKLLHLCPRYQNCPENCLCYLSEENTVLVNCTSANLLTFPAILPSTTSAVLMENNSLSIFQIPQTEEWNSVAYLNLDGNILNPWKNWLVPSGLEQLSIRNNKLEFLPEQLMKHIAAASFFRLDIRDNNFTCNCSFRSFKYWFTDNMKKIVSPKEVLCRRILNNNTKIMSVLQEVPVDAFCWEEDESKLKVVIIATTLSFVFLVIISSTVMYYRHKKLILAFLYSRYPSLFRFTVSSIDDDKTYDAFISYSNHDRDCVFSLISELENKYPFFRLCIHERDWLAGYPILYQIENSVKNSKKTILIMSEEFIQSFWFETELQIAYLQSLEDRIERLIIVIKGNLPPINTLPLDIQTILNTKTYLMWGERWFWEKLRYALPHYLPTNISDSSRNMIKSVDGMINTFVLTKNEQ